MGPPTFRKLLYSFVSLTPYILVLMFTIFYIKNYSLLITFWFLLGIIILIIICYLFKFILKLVGSKGAIRFDLIEKFGNMVIDKERVCNVIESPFLKNISLPAIDIAVIVFIWVYIFIMYFITDDEYSIEKEENMKLFNNYRIIVQRKSELTEDNYDKKGKENEKIDKELQERAKNKFFFNIFLSIIVGIMIVQYAVVFNFLKKCLGPIEIGISVLVGAGWAVGWRLIGNNQNFLLEHSGKGKMEKMENGENILKPGNKVSIKNLSWNSVIEDIIRRNNRRCSWDIFGTKYTCLK